MHGFQGVSDLTGAEPPHPLKIQKLSTPPPVLTNSCVALEYNYLTQKLPAMNI